MQLNDTNVAILMCQANIILQTASSPYMQRLGGRNMQCRLKFRDYNYDNNELVLNMQFLNLWLKGHQLCRSR